MLISSCLREKGLRRLRATKQGCRHPSGIQVPLYTWARFAIRLVEALYLGVREVNVSEIYIEELPKYLPVYSTFSACYRHSTLLHKELRDNAGSHHEPKCRPARPFRMSLIEPSVLCVTAWSIDWLLVIELLVILTVHVFLSLGKLHPIIVLE
jgi:hypothetical protein